jgi:hypothetical protein
MTDTFLNDKIYEVFESVLKKTHIFDKISELKRLNKGFIFFSTITSTFLILNSIYINYKLNIKYCKLKNKFEEIGIIHNKINEMIEINKNIIFLLKENQKLIQSNLNKQNISGVNSTISSESLYYNNNCNSRETIYQITNEENIEQNISKISNDEEFLSECYDNIPCNNIKKVTGFNRLFGW